jgi:UDP-N-acetylmuramyl pentapeptide phosphotransferase/UDP-N-acetylglucosamine-1-phosphate transferase
VITHVSDPVGTGVFQLTGVNSLMTVVALTATVAWLILLMNAMNWIDGSDGLAGGVGFIALASLALISLLPQTQDPITFSLAVIGAGSIAGFLIWNAPPARVYLGTVGSWWLGLYIGLVAIIGGGKVATALLVLALPVIDASWVIVQRALARQSLWRGDTRHLHHRLLAAGYSPRIVFSGALTLSGALGLAAVTLQTQHKLIALVIAGGMIVLGSIYLILRNHHASS